jgi:hypothetical protein
MSAGIGIKYEDDGEKPPPLEGFLRACGSMEVLGLITASVEFYLSLTYIHSDHLIHGEATISVEIHMLFFSKTAYLKLERDWATPSKGFIPGLLPVVEPISFATLIDFKDFKDYWNAFVPLEVI